MDTPHDADSDDDLDERLARVFEERGLPAPSPRPPARQPPPAAAPVAGAAPPAAPPPRALRPAPVAAATPPAPARRSGRREKTILLGMLGTLTGAFVGVLSMKLLVPRPPAGAGPDIHLGASGAETLDLVEPPALSALPPPAAIPPDPFRSLGLPPATPDGEGSTFREHDVAEVATADPLPPAGIDTDRTAADRYADRSATDGLSATAVPDLAPVPTDALPPSRFAAPALATDTADPSPSSHSSFAPPPQRIDSRGVVPTAASGPLDPRSTIAPPATPMAGDHVVRVGDTWWSLAEATYGDGRLYKALFAWNRTLDPRVSLVPGTRLELPREDQLRAAWGRLVP